MGGTVLGAGALAVGGSAVGGIMSTVSSMQQADAAQDQADYEATIAGYNQKMYKDQERQITDSGAYELRQQQLRQMAIMGEHPSFRCG